MALGGTFYRLVGCGKLAVGYEALQSLPSEALVGASLEHSMAQPRVHQEPAAEAEKPHSEGLLF